jgi:hypothetical protein
MQRQAFSWILLTVGIGSTIACQSLSNRPPLFAALTTDSTVVTAYHRGIGYTANIGFTLINTSGVTISRAGCGGPGWPDLEKKEDGQWVAVYYPIIMTCRTYPDFSWKPGAKIRDALHFEAFERGHNNFPEIRVDSISGVYRLRWSFTEGSEDGRKGARPVMAISNDFVIKLASSPAPASNTR